MDRCKHGRLYDIKKQGKIKYGPHNINTGSLAVKIKIISATTACGDLLAAKSMKPLKRHLETKHSNKPAEMTLIL